MAPVPAKTQTPDQTTTPAATKPVASSTEATAEPAHAQHLLASLLPQAVTPETRETQLEDDEGKDGSLPSTTPSESDPSDPATEPETHTHAGHGDDPVSDADHAKVHPECIGWACLG